MGDVKFDNKSYTMDSLATKYRNFFAPAFDVIVDGTSLLREGIAIPGVTVRTAAKEKADHMEFSVVNAFNLVSRDFQWLDTYFAPGKYIEIKMGYTDKLETVFNGVISSVKIDFPNSGVPTIKIGGMDISWLMTRGMQSATWHKKKYSDVVKEIGKIYTSKLNVDDTGTEIETIDKTRENDFEFLQDLAKTLNYDFFVVGQKLYFRNPMASTTPVVTLEWGKHLRSFNPKIDLADQISQVIVRGWDDKTQNVIEATSKPAQKLGSNSKTGSDIMGTLGGDSIQYLYMNIVSQDEAQTLADGEINRTSMKLITGKGECIGIPEIRAGRYIQLQGLGKKLSQLFYLTEVTHTLSASGYLTTFDVGGNAI
jgi:uncharacterized protein